jgi:RimJ/RimL family protein N-acetyltransferase
MIHPDNRASVAVARRLGMSPIRSDTLLGDPVTVYAIDRARWPERSGSEA